MAEGMVIVAGTKQLSKKLVKLLAMVEPRQRQIALMRAGMVLEAWMKRNVQAQHLIDTGNLRASITSEIEGETGVSVGPRNVRYAAIHEFGGTITPKKGQYLAIPKTKEARYAGSPRNMSGLHVVIGSKGGVLLDENDKVQYILTRSATIPAKPYVRPAMDEHGADAVKAMRDYLKKKIREIAEGTGGTG